MKRSVILGVVLACGFAVATPVLAQPGGGRGPGGFGGGGMMGMGGMGGGAMLLRNEAVQKELGIEESQLDELTAAQEEMQDKMPEFDFGSLRELSEEERNEKMAEFRDAMAKLTEEVNEKVNEILLPDQVDRLHQIEVQMQGIRAVQIERVAKELELTDSQKEKIEAAMTEQREKMQEMFQGGRGGPGGQGGTDPREAMTKLNEELQEAIEDVLTSSQKEKLEELKGEPFDVEQLRRRGGPGGGRGPGGPGGAPGGAPGRGQRPAGDGGNDRA